MTKRRAEIKDKKSRNVCQFCGKTGSNLIHQKCAISFLRSQGYELLDFDIRRVIFGGVK